jgi:hypothetical protein
MKYLILFILFTTSIFSQNSQSYLAVSLQESIYLHFDTIGVKASDHKFDCGCEFDAITKIYFLPNKEEMKSTSLDTVLLDWTSDELVESLINDYSKISKTVSRDIKEINIDVNIKRIQKTFNIIKWNWKVTYKVIVTYNYNPDEKKKA